MMKGENMSSVFTKIIQGELPTTKVAESENEIAILDIAPCSSGHTLVIAKKEVPKLEDLSIEEATSLMQFLYKVARAVSKGLDDVDYNIALNNGVSAGQEVPHVHFHIIPRPEGEEVDFHKKYQYLTGEKEEIVQRIQAFLEES